MSTRRVIILDFNGTIVLKEPPGKYLKREILGSSGFKPPEVVSLVCIYDKGDDEDGYILSMVLIRLLYLLEF